MGLKSWLIKPFAQREIKKVNRLHSNAIREQKVCFQNLIQSAKNTAFGKSHSFGAIDDHNDYQRYVPIRNYEAFKPYVEQIIAGESDVLWPGRPKYFAKTSGTTSGVKYIPISRDSIGYHISSARNVLFHYYVNTGKGDFFDGKMLYLSGSSTLNVTGGIPTGRLSGLVNHEIPRWITGNKLPSETINELDDWEEKLDLVIEECIKMDVRLIGGIPPWVQMFVERILQVSGKNSLLDLFPNLRLFIYGGVNYEPYRAGMEKLFGGSVPSLETYPASEGFIAYQDSYPHDGLILNTSAGMFFEFVPSEQFHTDNPVRLTLEEVELGQNYVILVSSNAGLWTYNLGDTIEFVSLNPYKVKVTGRIKHFISAFGEHVIGKEVEQAILTTSKKFAAEIVEFTVAPQIKDPHDGSAYHEWFIEFKQIPTDLKAFSQHLDKQMIEQNIYYKDLIDGNILSGLRIRTIQENGFRKYMESQGKLGGQNKVPRLANDRKIADAMIEQLLVMR